MQINALSTSIAAWQSRLADASQSTDKLQPTVLEDSSVASATMDAERPSVKDTSVPADPGHFDLYQQVDRPRDPNVVLRSANEIFGNTEAALGQVQTAYNDVVERLAASNPELANKEFGFSVGADGRLVLTSTGDLSDRQAEQVSDALNASSTLVAAANRYAQLHIEMVESDDVSMYGKFHLDLSNYAQTIDIGKEIQAIEQGRDYSSSLWFNQLWQKGEVSYGGWEKYENGAWVSAPDFKYNSISTYA